jgi:hypothetical protein
MLIDVSSLKRRGDVVEVTWTTVSGYAPGIKTFTAEFRCSDRLLHPLNNRTYDSNGGSLSEQSLDSMPFMSMAAMRDVFDEVCSSSPPYAQALAFNDLVMAKHELAPDRGPDPLDVM